MARRGRVTGVPLGGALRSMAGMTVVNAGRRFLLRLLSVTGMALLRTGCPGGAVLRMVLLMFFSGIPMH
jgi:hypothetical protein